MMENTFETKNTSNSKYHKKIIGYLDGSLSIEDKAEFEAYVRTHPEFEAQIKTKEDELSFLKGLIPAGRLSAQGLESLENEMKQSVLNLLKQEPKSVFGKIRNSFEEWINR